MEKPELKDAEKEILSSSSGDRLRLETHSRAQEASGSSLNDATLPQITLSEDLPKGSAETGSRSVVVVDKSTHKTHVLQMHHGHLEDVLTVPDATGKRPGLTPEGRFHIIAKEKNPTWYPPRSIGGHPVGPGPHNPLGVAKIRTDADGGLILLHGTNHPDQIGRNASHGCIRHNNNDMLKIYPLVQPGDAVYITRRFNDTRIFSEDFKARR